MSHNHSQTGWWIVSKALSRMNYIQKTFVKIDMWVIDLKLTWRFGDFTGIPLSYHCVFFFFSRKRNWVHSIYSYLQCGTPRSLSSAPSYQRRSEWTACFHSTWWVGASWCHRSDPDLELFHLARRKSQCGRKHTPGVPPCRSHWRPVTKQDDEYV